MKKGRILLELGRMVKEYLDFDLFIKIIFRESITKFFIYY